MAGSVPRRWVGLLLDHPRHLVLAALVGGLLLGPRAPVVVLGSGAVLAGVALAAAVSAGRMGARLAVGLGLAAVAAAAGAWVADARLQTLDRTALGPWFGHAVDIRATLLAPPRARSFGRSVAPARIVSGPGRGERVLVQTKGRIAGAVGEELRVRGGVHALPGFEQAARRGGAHALLKADLVASTGRRRGGVLGAVDRVRERAERALDRGLPPPLAGLARGMVLGEDDRLTPEMTEDFRASGLAHLVAASGANVALLAALVLAIGALVGIPRTPRLWLALVLVAGYVPLAGGGASIQRAGIMGAATLVAAMASRPASRWYVLLLAAGATLALNPRAVEDPGWQLSFAAVLALMLLVGPLRRGLGRRLPRPAAEALAVCLAAAAATAPLIALHFGRLSWVTVPANLLAVPAVAPVMWLGTGAAALGQVSADLAGLLTTLAGWPLAFVAWVGHGAAGLPGADAEIEMGAAMAAVWAALLAAVAVGPVRRRISALASRRRLLVLAAAAGLAAVAAGAGAGPPEPPSGLVVSALDVGQGDATLIQHGRSALLVDTGPADGPILERLEEAGVEHLDLLVVTHAQADHLGGAAAVLDAVAVDAVLDGRDGVRVPDGERLAAAARSHGIRMIAAGVGQRIRAGPLVLEVLSPRPEPPALHAGEDPNQRAVVAELRDGAFSMLLAADAESDVLSALPLQPVDVLKVSHHGSADPGLPAVLARLRPSVALIEVGRGNRYGHPAPSTLEALRVVPRVYRTDRDGTVRIQPET